MIYSRPASKDCPFPVARGDLLNSRLKTGGNRSKIRPPGRITAARKAGGDKRPDVLRSVVLRQRPPASAGRGLWQISRFRRAVKERRRQGTARFRGAGMDRPAIAGRFIARRPDRAGADACLPRQAQHGAANGRRGIGRWERCLLWQARITPAIAGVRGGGANAVGRCPPEWNDGQRTAASIDAAARHGGATPWNGA